MFVFFMWKLLELAQTRKMQEKDNNFTMIQSLSLLICRSWKKFCYYCVFDLSEEKKAILSYKLLDIAILKGESEIISLIKKFR